MASLDARSPTVDIGRAETPPPWQRWKDIMNTRHRPHSTGRVGRALPEVGANHTPTVHADWGSVITFRDTDMRQYTMF